MDESIDIDSKLLWERAKSIYLSTLQSEQEKEQVERYLSMITAVTCSNNHFVILTSNAYAADFLKNGYSGKFKSCLDLAGGDAGLTLEFKFDENVKRPSIVIPSPNKKGEIYSPRKMSAFSSTMPLNEEYTFDEFVRGPSNSWALAAAQGVVANPGKSGYNPLFIHGGTGLGKTHLMQAIGNELRLKHPELAICYLTAETFLNEYVNSLKNGQIESFRNSQIQINYPNKIKIPIENNPCVNEGEDYYPELIPSFTILFATEMGTAETFATNLHEEATQKLHLKANILNVEKVTNVKIFNESALIVFIASTFGEGEPTDFNIFKFAIF